MRKFAVILAFFGGLLVTFGLLSRFYVYPAVAVLPAGMDSTVVATTAPDDPAEYLDLAQLKVVEAPLQQTVRLKGYPSVAQEASTSLGEDVVVWKVSSCLDKVGVDCFSQRWPIAGSIDVAAYNSFTGIGVPWGGAYHENDGKELPALPTAEGPSIKFAFDTQPVQQQWWDDVLVRNVPMEYVGEEAIDGLTVYRFRGSVEPTSIGTIDVPGSLVGSDQPTVTADRMYTTQRDYTVEPVTGVIITRQESPVQYLAVGGERKVTLLDATMAVDDASVAETVSTYKTLSVLLQAAHTTIPIVGVSLGAICAVLAVILTVRSRRDGSGRQPAPTTDQALARV